MKLHYKFYNTNTSTEQQIILKTLGKWQSGQTIQDTPQVWDIYVTSAARIEIQLQRLSFDEKIETYVLAHAEAYSLTLQCNTMVYVT